jgi:hypothetical protein
MLSLSNMCLTEIALKVIEEIRPGLNKVIQMDLEGHVFKHHFEAFKMCLTESINHVAMLPILVIEEFFQIVEEKRLQMGASYWINFYAKFWLFHYYVDHDDVTMVQHFAKSVHPYTHYAIFVQYALMNNKLKVAEYYLQNVKQFEIYPSIVSKCLDFLKPRGCIDAASLIYRHFPEIKHFDLWIVIEECIFNGNFEYLKEIDRAKPYLSNHYYIEPMCKVVSLGLAKTYHRMLFWCWKRINPEFVRRGKFMTRQITYIPLKDGECVFNKFLRDNQPQL